jgi:pyruvate-ferredoxin/flavodoxin oxidoreductase
VRRLRRDAVPQAAHAAVRRSLLIANATGCSSIYGGNLPTTPYTTNKDGRGPAWSNSLFEDNAEFGLGMRLALDCHVSAGPVARHAPGGVASRSARERAARGRSVERHGVAAQRVRVQDLRRALSALGTPEAVRLEALADYLVKKSVWLVGGDGWAYDIGFGGLDHVLASHYDVNILVLDTEVYSNTGGQQSKATPLGAWRSSRPRQDGAEEGSGLLANMYGHVYVARVAFGAKMPQTVRALQEAEAYPGRR